MTRCEPTLTGSVILESISNSVTLPQPLFGNQESSPAINVKKKTVKKYTLSVPSNKPASPIRLDMSFERITDTQKDELLAVYQDSTEVVTLTSHISSYHDSVLPYAANDGYNYVGHILSITPFVKVGDSCEEYNVSFTFLGIRTAIV